MAKRHVAAASIAVFIAFSAIYLAGFPRARATESASQAIGEISPARYMQDVVYLASDALRGRGNGSPELDRAADYIARQFRAAGLQPAGENHSYFQDFEITTGARLGPKNALELDGKPLTINRDFIPIVFSDSADFSGTLMFAGYGITAPEYHYDDYAGLDVHGKIVAVLSHEPQERDTHSIFAGANLTRHALLVNKAINAKLHGAKGVIILTDFNHDKEDINEAAGREDFADMGIPAAYALRGPFIDAFKRRGKDIAALEKTIDADLKPQSFELPDLRVRVATDIVRTKRTIRNVIAAIPGSDPALKQEWIVVGAHYDHLGLGNRNSLAPSQIGQIHHGADDNASGTAGIMELARIADKHKGEWQRSLLFIAFSGEEIGLLGSSYFVNHPTVALAKVDGMINMDMIGRLSKDRLFVGGIGTSPGLKSTVQTLDQTEGLKIDFSDSGYGSSDHTSFNAKKIPVLFFFSGLHTDYHKPSDTSDKINAPGAVKVLSLVYLTMDRLASHSAKLPYTEVHQPQPQTASARAQGYGPYFGSVPDFRDDLNGVLFSDVQNNSPAAKAGLKGGDLLVEFDGKPIQNLNDYAYALRAKQPGDIVQVVVKRNGEDVKAAVVLEPRR
jgi:Zn-dependent M28 family amino/carboxypeptidase